MKKFAKAFLGAALSVSLLAGCGGAADTAATTTDSSAPAKTEAPAAAATTTTDTTEEAPAAPEAGLKVGVSMPTKDLQRWNQDGANMEKELIAAGYEVDLQYAANDVQQQLSQVE
nr:sugar ABC transporter substrate-binding protein [Lachnospiraceae bacterium]